MTDALSEQLEAVRRVVDEILGQVVEGLYLYGSAVAGGLKPSSDVDLFLALKRPTTRDQRAALVRGLTPLSQRTQRPLGWRPVELTAVVASDVNPWRYPPRTDFQYGEWLRDRFERAEFDPENPLNPDLAILIAQVRAQNQTLAGSSASQFLPPITQVDSRRALLAVVPDLLKDLQDDTANVLLTLARVSHTLATEEFTSKDAAADWAMSRLPASCHPTLTKARDVYLGTAVDDWTSDQSGAQATADQLVAEIRRAAET